MSTDPKRSPRRGWQVGNDAAEGKRAWRKEKPVQEPARRKGWRRFVFWMASVLFVATLGALGWLAIRPTPPAPAHLLVVSADYTTNLGVSHNLPGRQAARELYDYAEANRQPILWWTSDLFAKPTWTELTNETRSTSAWAESLANRTERTLIVYFAVHGGVDEHGPYLIPNDHDPYAQEAEKRLLRVDAVLEQLPQEKKTVLILDATQITASWPLGLLHNDFAQGLKDLLEKEGSKFPNLVVLSASAPRERSWSSDAWRSTAFGHYVSEGLAGAANTGRGRVSAAELYEFVRARVANWAYTNRNEVQVPFLWHGEGTKPAQVELVAVPQAARFTEAAEAPDPDETQVNRREALVQKVKAD